MVKFIRVAACFSLIVLAIVSAVSPSFARSHRHWKAGDVYAAQVNDPVISPCTYVYPTADWRPFFYRMRHYGPIEHMYPHSPCYAYYLY